MADFSIEIGGLDGLIARIRKAGADLMPTMRRAMSESMFYVHSKVPPYPAPPAGSTYRRTGTLGRSIGVEVRSLGSEVVGVIGTPIVYAPYVISSAMTQDGRGPQARVHEGRWWTLQKVVFNAIDEVRRIHRWALRQLFGGGYGN
jgi:hypothetical protein